MIKETYCSFEVSKLLKEKGFNEKCRGGYHCEFDNDDNSIIMFERWMAQPYNNDFVDEGFLCSAPTHQMALAWLRKEYDISVEISALKRYHWVYTIYRLFEEKVAEVWNDGTYVSYEEAVEAALKYVLENLI